MVWKHLLAIAAAGLACSSRAAELTTETTRAAMNLPEPAIDRQVEGSVMGPDQKPVAGALVSVIDRSSYRGVGFSVSDRDGRFAVGLLSTPVVLTATANGHVAGTLVPTAANRFVFSLAKPSEATRRFAGTVVDAKGRPRGHVRVRLMNWNWPVGAAFYTSSDETGRFQFSVDAAGSYDLMIDDPSYIGSFAPLLHRDVENARLVAYERAWIIAAANRADESALRELCVPLTGHGARQLAGSLRAATVIGLGESTHGTREYTELRSRVIEGLMRDGWLTTIALEASWEEVARLDDYVRRGEGAGRDAVKALAYWPWRTEEFVTFVESIRTLNTELPADEKIEFIGIDDAPPGATANFMRHYFESDGPAHSGVLSGLDPLRRIVNWLERSTLSVQEHDEAVRTLKELEHLAERQPLGSLVARQGLRITQLIMESHDGDDDFRDPVMAEAVLALLSRSDKQRRVAIWAHSQHVAQGPIEGAVPMGHYLRTRLGEKYRAIGSMFYRGSFRTYSGLQSKMVNHVVALPPPFYFEGVMQRVFPSGPSGACVLDVAEATRRSGIRDWISVPKHVRIYGGLEISESYPWPPVIVPDLWSAMIFVPATSPTTPLDGAGAGG